MSSIKRKGAAMGMVRRLSRSAHSTAYRLGLASSGVRSLRARIERLLDTDAHSLFQETGIPGLSITVSLRDRARITRCWGLADLEANRAIDPATVFQAMSISKVVTALGVCALARDRRIDLDAPVWRSLCSWRLPADRAGGFNPDLITPRRLLSHTAGLNIHAYGWAPLGQGPTNPVDLLEGGDASGTTPLEIRRQPGQGVLYSGGAFALLELLVTDATGESFASAMKRLVLDPLAMHSSAFDRTDELLTRLARRYVVLPTGKLAATPHRQPASRAGTGMYTTAGDLCTFMEFILAAAQSRDPSLAWAAAMATPQSPITRGAGTGLGFHLWPKRSDTIFAHRGHRDGWWSECIGFIRRQAAIVVMCNGDMKERCAKAISSRLRQCILDHGV